MRTLLPLLLALPLASCPGLGVASGPGATGVVNVASTPENTQRVGLALLAAEDLLFLYPTLQPNALVAGTAEEELLRMLQQVHDLLAEARAELQAGRDYTWQARDALYVLREVARHQAAKGKPLILAVIALGELLTSLLPVAEPPIEEIPPPE